jgi:hypothetical protein
LDAGGWGDYAGAVAGKDGAVLFAGRVAGVEGEGKDEQTECRAKGLTVEWSGGVMESWVKAANIMRALLCLLLIKNERRGVPTESPAKPRKLADAIEGNTARVSEA